MFMVTPKFQFLDITNYLGPGTSHEKWISAYCCLSEKSWFLHEWFDSKEKLDYPRWYLKLKEEFVLSLREWKECKKLFKAKGMKTFADWLQYYNNEDIAPELEALQKMRNFYIEKELTF